MLPLSGTRHVLPTVLNTGRVYSSLTGSGIAAVAGTLLPFPKGVVIINAVGIVVELCARSEVTLAKGPVVTGAPH